MSGRNNPNITGLNDVAKMERDTRMVVGWYAGAMGLKRFELDTLAGVELALEGTDRRVLSIVCYWKEPPSASQEAAMAAAAAYTYGFNMPVVHVLAETGKSAKQSPLRASNLN